MASTTADERPLAHRARASIAALLDRRPTEQIDNVTLTVTTNEGRITELEMTVSELERLIFGGFAELRERVTLLELQAQAQAQS